MTHPSGAGAPAPAGKALVTGAAGFIGSHLCERLLADGYDVRGIDAFTDNYARDRKEHNLRVLLEDSRFELEEKDVIDASLDELVEDADIVFHLAARPGVRDSWSEFDAYVDANILATKRLVESCAHGGVPIVYASSSSVYGDAPALPAVEASPLHPVSPYGATKVMTEMTAGAYARSLGLWTVGLRFFTVFGPRQRPDMGIARLIARALRGESLPIYGDGRQRRDFTYVTDVVAAIVAAAARGVPGRVYNVASGQPVELLTVVAALERLLGSGLEVRFESTKQGDVRDTWGDIALAQRELDYRPETPLEVGLRAQLEAADELVVVAGG